MKFLKQSPEVTPTHMKFGAGAFGLALLSLLVPGPDSLGVLRQHVTGNTNVVYRDYAGGVWHTESGPARGLSVDRADQLLAPLTKNGWKRAREDTRSLGGKNRGAMLGAYDERVRFTSADGSQSLRASKGLGQGPITVSGVRRLGFRERTRVWVASLFGRARVLEGRP